MSQRSVASAYAELTPEQEQLVEQLKKEVAPLVEVRRERSQAEEGDPGGAGVLL